MKKLFATILCALSASAMTLMAVPAKPTPFKYTQPDGTTVMLQLRGDERSHVMTTTEGYPVARDADGYYCFAELDAENVLKATEVRAGNISDLNMTERSRIVGIAPSDVNKILAVRSSGKFKSPARMSGHNGIGLMDDAFLGYKELKGLVILAQYTDVKFASGNDKEFFSRMLNEKGFKDYNATGSARDYFIDSSNGAFIPEFDVYGPVTLPNSMSYYGGNDDDGNDLRPAQMIRDACKGLDGEINFKDYDIDGDGYVDNVFVFYAGYGEASYGSENTVWPHQWEISAAGLSLKLDGVYINKYACSNEMELNYSGNPVPDGVGTFVHEFSHVLGLPDLYDTSGNGSWTPGPWSVLDQGPYNNDSRTPPAYSVFERNALGWCEPVEITGAASVSLEAINKSNRAYLIPTSKQNEFFLIENRQQTGWDKYLPGHGMLVWHIDYNQNVWYRNAVNNTSSHNYVDIEEAGGSYAEYNNNYNAYMKALAEYPFPGTKGVTSFTDSTTPSMKTWAGKELGLPITDIAETDGVITFNVAGGRCDAEVPVIAQPSEKGDDWFVATWNASEGAVSYILTVEQYSESAAATETAGFGSSSTAVLPEGWELIGTSARDVYMTNGNFGESAPSLKLSKTGYGFETREFDRDVKSIVFWLKGQGTDSKSSLLVEGYANSMWTEITTIKPQQNKAETVTLGDIPDGVRKIRVIYTKSSGNVAIDDFAVTYGGSGNVALPGYDELNVGNVTSYKVTGIPADAASLSYKVRAVDAGGNRSAYSEVCQVSLGEAGIEPVTVGNSASLMVSGLSVTYTGTADDTVTVYDLRGHTVVTANADSEGSAEITLPSAGIYILHSPGLTEKIAAK